MLVSWLCWWTDIYTIYIYIFESDWISNIKILLTFGLIFDNKNLYFIPQSEDIFIYIYYIYIHVYSKYMYIFLQYYFLFTIYTYIYIYIQHVSNQISFMFYSRPNRVHKIRFNFVAVTLFTTSNHDMFNIMYIYTLNIILCICIYLNKFTMQFDFYVCIYYSWLKIVWIYTFPIFWSNDTIYAYIYNNIYMLFFWLRTLLA